MNERAIQFEELLAHQQRLLEDLDSVVTQQRQEMDVVRSELARLKETIRRLVEAYESAEETPNERPPHY